MAEQYIKIDTNGSKFYYKDREMKISHREDGPAIEWSDGGKEWCINDQHHREDGPAIEYASGSKFWYMNGKLHREDGPAVEWSDGSKHWYFNDSLHREDGPAVVWAEGLKEWYLNGKSLTEEEHAKHTVKEVVVSMDEIAKLLNIPVEKLKIQK
jgi:hypothetical protein